MTLIFHLARAGLIMFAISIAHSVFHAQTTIWISSIKRMIFQSDFSTSFKMAFILSSKSHLYLLPAMSAQISSSIIFLCLSISGTSSLMICCARSSIIAVFQTPGSHTSTGLFFVLRERICISLRSSSSLPITGSSFPSWASWVISFPYLDKASRLTSGLLSWIFSPSLILRIVVYVDS